MFHTRRAMFGIFAAPFVRRLVPKKALTTDEITDILAYATALRICNEMDKVLVRWGNET